MSVPSFAVVVVTAGGIRGPPALTRARHVSQTRCGLLSGTPATPLMRILCATQGWPGVSSDRIGNVPDTTCARHTRHALVPRMCLAKHLSTQPAVVSPLPKALELNATRRHHARGRQVVGYPCDAFDSDLRFGRVIQTRNNGSSRRSTLHSARDKRLVRIVLHIGRGVQRRGVGSARSSPVEVQEASAEPPGESKQKKTKPNISNGHTRPDWLVVRTGRVAP